MLTQVLLKYVVNVYFISFYVRIFSAMETK